MGYVTTQQTGNIIDLNKVKAHCYVFGDSEDALLNMYIAAACQRFTELTGVVINPSKLEYRADSFTDIIRLHRSPVKEITSVTYRDTSGAEQTIPVADVLLDNSTRPARIAVKGGKWPATDGTPGNIVIAFDAGHDTLADLPELIEWAILSMVGSMYEFREEAVSGTIITKVPQSAEMVINMFQFTDV